MFRLVRHVAAPVAKSAVSDCILLITVALVYMRLSVTSKKLIKILPDIYFIRSQFSRTIARITGEGIVWLSEFFSDPLNCWRNPRSKGLDPVADSRSAIAISFQCSDPWKPTVNLTTVRNKPTVVLQSYAVETSATNSWRRHTVKKQQANRSGPSYDILRS